MQKLPYAFTENDYNKTHETVGLCEIQGSRPTQEDQLKATQSLISGFDRLSDICKKQALKKTIAEMQQKYCDSDYYVGSTLCAAITWVDPVKQILNVSVANLGDSAAYLVILGDKNDAIRSKRINILHNPDPGVNPDEYQRVPRPYKTAKDLTYRIGGLSVSRALGDKAHEEEGLAHDPDIYIKTFDFKGDDRAFVIVACDGLQELNEEEIGDIVLKCCQERAEIIARSLVLAAYDAGSSDNISAAVIEVSQTLTSALVLDGHGGDEVARAVAPRFYPALQNHIGCVPLLKDVHDKSVVEKYLYECIQYCLKDNLTFEAIKHWLSSVLDRDQLLPKLSEQLAMPQAVSDVIEALSLDDIFTKIRAQLKATRQRCEKFTSPIKKALEGEYGLINHIKTHPQSGVLSFFRSTEKHILKDLEGLLAQVNYLSWQVSVTVNFSEEGGLVFQEENPLADNCIDLKLIHYQERLKEQNSHKRLLAIQSWTMPSC